MQKGYLIEGDVIAINRELTELDLFVRDFLDVLKKHSDYLIVSGYVSISTGRTRGTEDVDVLVPVMDFEKFDNLFNELCQKGFWCYQGDSSEEAYSYFKDMLSIRFARVNQLFPNIEFIPINAGKKLQFYEFSNPQKLRIDGFELKIPPIEFEILYKEIVLRSEKDLDDAKHLRETFKGMLKDEKLKIYERMIREK